MVVFLYPEQQQPHEQRVVSLWSVNPYLDSNFEFVGVVRCQLGLILPAWKIWYIKKHWVNLAISQDKIQTQLKPGWTPILSWAEPNTLN